MTTSSQSDIPVGPAILKPASGPPRFSKPDAFRQALRLRVDRYFADTGRSPRDCPQMYVKSAVVFGFLAASYALLVFGAQAWWQSVPLAVLLGLSMAAVGFNIQHDGGHRAYSDRPWINKLTAMTLDLLGASSYLWARKHNSLHHSYVNITGHDDDVDIGWLGRFSPHQRRLPLHRFQHVYLWGLYGFLPIKWHLLDDFRNLAAGRIGGHRFPRPGGRDLLTFLGGKMLFFSLAFVIPMLLHPWWLVLTFYALASFVEGVVLSVVFQLAHCVEQAEFPMPGEDGSRMGTGWAAHQVETTVDFAPRNRPLSWFIGGLNFQIEHHLFPQVCHVHYPALASIVAATCREYGLRYRVHETFASGVASHYRWLHRMGRPDAGSEKRSPAEERFAGGARGDNGLAESPRRMKELAETI